MSDIYGPITEHPEFPIEDSRRFTITIKVHDFEERKRSRYERLPDEFCDRCGYHKDASVHTKETK